MTRGMSTLAVALCAAMLPLRAGPAAADNVRIDISTPGVTFGLNIGAPPPLSVVPGLPVYYAPAVPANYFVYGGYYYLFHQGTWFYSHHHNGPWVGLAIHQVPRPLLRVPVKYYKTPPGHAKKAGPPKWVGDGRGKGKHKRR